VVFPPPFPPKPPAVPFGRRLAQALSACWKLGFPDAAPAPGVGGPPVPPDVGVTPFFSRQDRNAVSDALPDVDEVGVVVGFVVVVVVELEELAAPPHAAARRAIATITMPTVRRRRLLEDVARCHLDRSGVRSWACSRVLMAVSVAGWSVFGLQGSCRFLQDPVHGISHRFSAGVLEEVLNFACHSWIVTSTSTRSAHSL
jgi:hypothetical protein